MLLNQTFAILALVESMVVCRAQGRGHLKLLRQHAASASTAGSNRVYAGGPRESQVTCVHVVGRHSCSALSRPRWR